MKNNGKKFKAYVYMLIPDCEEARANGDDKKMYIGQTDDIKKRQGDWRDLSTPYAGEKMAYRSNCRLRIQPEFGGMKKMV